MPSNIALFICSGFVAALLMLDYRRFKTQPIFGWVPTLWILYSASRPVSQWFIPFQVGVDFNIEEGSPMDRRLLLALIIAGLLILWRRKIDWGRVVSDNRWLLLLFLYMLVSILWSDNQFVSLKRYIKTFGCIVMALVVLTGPSPFKETEAIFRRMIYILIPLSALLIKYFPIYGRKFGRYTGVPEWIGVCTGKNGLGLLCMISVIFLVWTWINRSKENEAFTGYDNIAYGLILTLTIWLQLAAISFSATSFIVLIVGLISLFMFRRMKSSGQLSTIVISFILIGGVSWIIMYELFSINPITSVASMLGRSGTLTGRSDMIWPQLIPICKEHFVVGKGYGGFWLTPLVFDKMTVNEAHNGYIDIFIELGVVGMILFVILILAYYKKAKEVFKYDVEWGSFMLSFLIISLLHNITESSYLKSTALIWNIFVILMFLQKRANESMSGKISN